MKSIKIGSLVVAAFFTFNSFGQAEGRPEVREKRNVEEKVEREKQTPDQKAHAQTDHMTKQLSLTEEQKSRAYDTNLGINMKNEAILADENMSKEQKKQMIDANNEARQSMIKSMLSKEQVAKFEKMEEKKEERQEMKTNETAPKKGGKKASGQSKK